MFEVKFFYYTEVRYRIFVLGLKTSNAPATGCHPLGWGASRLLYRIAHPQGRFGALRAPPAARGWGCHHIELGCLNDRFQAATRQCAGWAHRGSYRAGGSQSLVAQPRRKVNVVAALPAS